MANKPSLLQLLGAESGWGPDKSTRTVFGAGTPEAYIRQRENRRKARLGIPFGTPKRSPDKSGSYHVDAGLLNRQAKARRMNKRQQAKAERAAKRLAWKNRGRR